MSIQLPDGTAISNWSPGWEKNLPKWYTDGYESGLFNESNNWGHDFFPQYSAGKKIPAVIPGGSSMVPGYPSPSEGLSEFPSLGGKIENFLSNLPKAPGLPGERRTTEDGPNSVDPSWVLRGQPGVQPDPTFTGEDWLNQQLPSKSPRQPEDKTLRQRVWERDQMPDRTPDSSGRLYPDKNDPGFLDPRIQGDGRMTMQYIPELDDPNWTPWKDYTRGRSFEGGEGIQYRR